MGAEDLGTEVNRLYWESAAPVTRLAGQLGISRGTFYNHLKPRDARAACGSCGGALEFRTRSDRETRTGHCASCGREQTVAESAGRPRRTSAGRSARALRAEPVEAAATGQGREASLLSARASYLSASAEEEDRRRTQLLVVAVGAAVLGLGFLFLSRRS